MYGPNKSPAVWLFVDSLLTSSRSSRNEAKGSENKQRCMWLTDAKSPGTVLPAACEAELAVMGFCDSVVLFFCHAARCEGWANHNATFFFLFCCAVLYCTIMRPNTHPGTECDFVVVCFLETRRLFRFRHPDVFSCTPPSSPAREDALFETISHLIRALSGIMKKKIE